MTIAVSGLPLLAHKVGPNLFDLSSNLHHVSMRDQMHRAVALAEALFDGQQFNESNQVLIVGAGVAGVSAGIVLARHGVDVLVVDTSSDAPFALQRKVSQRFVGPYMYEWPLALHTAQFMPPLPGSVLSHWDAGVSPPLGWPLPDPGPPDQYVQYWDNDLQHEMHLAGGRLCLLKSIDPTRAQMEIGRWLAAQRNAFRYGNGRYSTVDVSALGGVPWAGSPSPSWPIRPRFVILAAGMGSERHVLKDELTGAAIASGAPFWTDDDLLAPNAGKAAPPRVVVLGGGDGALQDALRALTGDDHPLKTWQRLVARDGSGELAGMQARVLALEHQHAQTTIWARGDVRGSGINEPLDTGYKALAEHLAKDRALAQDVIACLRPDVASVHLCVREQHFGKAYALNRFMVHVFEQCVARHGSRSDQDRFTVLRGISCVGSTPSSAGTRLSFGGGVTLDADVVVVRVGVDASKLPRTWLALNTKDSVNRQDLSAVPLPLYFPPSL